MYVVATAGHVDHGKSTLVQALTGRDPDRWAEEKDRGLTIDLGFVWVDLPSGKNVAFVDVPGHEKFLGNMLAGIGPVQVVMFIVAADQGWQQQSTDHLDALHALGITHGLVALTRADKASPEQIAEVTADIHARFSQTGLAGAPIVPVSAIAGTGMEDLKITLDQVLAHSPQPDPQARVRMWLDRSFVIKGAGTVVTGTLAAGTITEGETLQLAGKKLSRAITVRGLQSEEVAEGRIGPVNRVAVNIRGVDADSVHRGDQLLTPGAWWLTDTIDVRRVTGQGLADIPREVATHIGTVELNAGVRKLDDDHVRLTLPRKLALTRHDRLVLRAPGDHAVFAGVEILDVDPEPLKGRGSSARQAEFLQTLTAKTKLQQRRAMLGADARAQGWELAGLQTVGAWVLAGDAVETWATQLKEAVAQSDPLHPGITRGAALSGLGLPAEELLDAAIKKAGLSESDGRIVDASHKVDLGPAEEGIATIEEWLDSEPFRAPEADEIRDLKLNPKQLAAAEKAGRIIRLGADRDIILLPSAPQLATTTLAGLDQPFSVSQARKALDTSRRIAIPLLEYMDEKKLTRRGDGGQRTVV